MLVVPVTVRVQVPRSFPFWKAVTELEAGGTYLLNISFTGGPSGDNPEALALVDSTSGPVRAH